MIVDWESQLQTAAHLLSSARRVVCLTGAGISAESGVATFRDDHTGLWSRFDPMTLASQTGFANNPGLVWQWYMHRLAIVEEARPNPAHLAVARLEKLMPSLTVVTQNVDDLHERAGSRHVLHLHGRLARFHCNTCSYAHDLLPAERKATLPPRCPSCGGLVRPGVVWFGEPLPSRVLDHAWAASSHCDVMLVIGTSGVVYPAAQLPLLAQQSGARLIDVNPHPTPISEVADLYLQGRSGDLLPRLVDLIAARERTAA